MRGPRCVHRSLARTGTLQLAHGEVRTPAFVPLATKGSVKLLEPRDVEALGYEMVLGNTFHLFLAPGPELIATLGGLNRVHALAATDHHRLRRLSGVLDGSRERRRRDQGPASRRRGHRGGHRCPAGGRDPDDQRRGRALSLLRRRQRADAQPGALDGRPGGAALRHRARARRMHPVPCHPRLHRPLHRAHPPLARALPALACGARARRPGGVRDRPGRDRARSAARVDRRRSRRAPATGSRSAARSAATSPRCTRSSRG